MTTVADSASAPARHKSPSFVDTILPPTADNHYKAGCKKLVVYGFYAITALTVLRSLLHLLLNDGGAQLIATIPLDDYSTQCKNNVIAIFGLWGLQQLVLGLVYVVVILRYKSLIPLMWCTVAGEWGARLLITVTGFRSVETDGTAPGGVGNFIVPFLALGMVAAAVRGPRSAAFG